MAATAVTSTILARGTAAVLPATAAVDATDGALVTAGGKDITLILFNDHGTTTKTATIKSGDGVFKGPDLAVSLTTKQTKVLHIETGPYEITTGANKGKILVTGTDADIKVAALIHP